MASLVSSMPHRSTHQPPPDLWPVRPAARWLLRAALALPFVLVAVTSRSLTDPSGANVDLARRGALIDWGSTRLGWVAEVFPPLSAGIASVLHGSALGMHLVAAVVIGFSLQRLAGILVGHGVGGPATVAVMATLVLTPPLHYLAVHDLQAVLGLVLVVLALQGIDGFVVRRSTESGFRAGIALGVAVMVDSGAWLYALTLAAVAPFLATRGGEAAPGRNRATVGVLAFPAAAALVFWLYICWWFSGDRSGGLLAAPVDGWFPGGVGASGRHALLQLGEAVLAVPLFVTALGFRLVRNRWSLVAPAVAIVGLFLSLWLGLRQASGQGYVSLTALYVLLMVVRQPSRRRRQLITAVALLQIGIIWTILLVTTNPIGTWLRSVAAAW